MKDKKEEDADVSSSFAVQEKRKERVPKNSLFGPSVEIRTQGLLNPIQARYQTSPHPDIHSLNESA